MRFTTADGSYGVAIWPAGADYDARFFGFQLIIGGQLLGDAESSIVSSAVDALFRLPELSDPRLQDAATDPERALNAVLNDERCNRALYAGSESLDFTVTAAYLDQGRAVWLAQAMTGDGERMGPVAVASIAVDDYDELVHRVRDYHQREQVARS